MHEKTTILLGLILTITAMPMANAGHPNTNCNPTEVIHGYSGSSGTYTGSHPPPVVLDNCINGDGEYEFGIGGARFPAGTSFCAWNAHHGFGVGAQHWADETFGFNVIYTVGTDGPALIQDPTGISRCLTNGIISNNPVTDPFDCGSGAVGIYAPGFVWTPATLGSNGSTCDPYDGYVWGWTWNGMHFGTGSPIMSTPTDGHFWG